MANEMRDRLVELYKEANAEYLDYLESIDQKGLVDTDGKASFIVDRLIENGVIVPLCRLGDTVYTNVCGKTKGFVVVSMEFAYTTNGFESKVVANNGEYPLLFGFKNISKTVFLTKAEAEQKLKEMRGR